MSHEIMQSDRVAYYGKTPWHGIGAKMAAGQSVDDWLRAAGLDYPILEAPVTFTDQNGITRTFDEKKVLYCGDNGQPLHVPTTKYNTVQPREAFEVYRDHCEKGSLALEVGGTLRDRRTYWGLAKVAEPANIAGDAHTPYKLFVSSADGTSATMALDTVIRAVCANTIHMALGMAEKVHKFTHRSKYNRNEVRKALGLEDFEDKWSAFRRTMESLAVKPVSDTQARELFSELLRPKAERERTARQNIGAQDFDALISGQPLRGRSFKAETDRKVRGLETLFHCYQSAPGAVPGTAYGVVQGVTRYIDHERGKSADKRLASAWLGQGAKLKARAVELATEL